MMAIDNARNSKLPRRKRRGYTPPPHVALVATSANRSLALRISSTFPYGPFLHDCFGENVIFYIFARFPLKFLSNERKNTFKRVLFIFR